MAAMFPLPSEGRWFKVLRCLSLLDRHMDFYEGLNGLYI